MSLLSDEQIKEVWSVTCGNTQEEMRIDFARAIEAAVLEAQKQEPVACMDENGVTHSKFKFKRGDIWLYAAPVVQPDMKKLQRAAEIYAAERDQARERYERMVEILCGIHALLYPPHYTTPDGRTYQFKSPIVEEQMQALSDRIRSIPDEIAAAEGKK